MSTILKRIEAHLALTGMSPSAFGLEVMGDKNLIKRLRNGADLRLSTVAKIERVLGGGKAARSRRGGDGVVDATSHQPAEGAAR